MSKQLKKVEEEYNKLKSDFDIWHKLLIKEESYLKDKLNNIIKLKQKVKELIENDVTASEKE